MNRGNQAMSLQPQPSAAPDMNIFLQMTGVIQKDIEELSKRITEVEDCHVDLALSGGRNQEASKKLDMFYSQITSLNDSIFRKLQDLKNVVNNSSGTGTQTHLMKNQFDFLQQNYRNNVERYQHGRDKYLEKMRKNMRTQLSITGGDMSEEQMDNLIDSGQSVSVFSGDYLRETAEAKRMFEEVSTRHEEITRLEKTIREIRDMFLEVSRLIEEQGTMIDRIAVNTATAQMGTESSGKQLEKALVLKRKSRRCCICIVVTIIVILLIIALILTIYFVTNPPKKT